jgi:hypothetical protein
MIYTLYIYNYNAKCLYYKEWNRRNQSELSTDEEQALVYGLVYSIKATLSRLAKTEQMAFTYRTDIYRLHYYETATGLTWVMMTGLNVTSMQDVLQHMYTQIYVPCVALNPLYVSGEPLKIQSFVQSVDRFVQNLAVFRKQ